MKNHLNVVWGAFVDKDDFGGAKFKKGVGV